jgi:hypothetical protein
MYRGNSLGGEPERNLRSYVMILKRDERITCSVIVLASSSTIYKYSTNPNQVKITYDHQELDMV